MPADAVIVERVRLRSRRRRGAAIDVILDRARENRSQPVFTTARGRDAVFWQNPRTRKQARPGVRTPTARAAGIPDLQIVRGELGADAVRDPALARSGRCCCPNRHASASPVGRQNVGWLVLLHTEGSEENMRAHDNDHGYESELRPKASRLEEPESALALKAALSGRLDVAGPAGLVGLQRAAGNSAASTLIEEERSPVHDVITSGGTPLPVDVRTDMEGRFGQDFGDVRVHNDGSAHESAKSVNAQAYTVGSNIVFNATSTTPPPMPEGT